jgi:hypothetical protein
VATPDADKLTNAEILRIMENNKNEPAHIRTDTYIHTLTYLR